MIAIYTTMTCAICGYSQERYVGTDIVGAVCFGSLQLNLAYAFAPQWSAGADLGLNISTIINYNDELEKEHRESLGLDLGILSQGTQQTTGLQNICIHLCYWPIVTFCGPSIRLGCQVKGIDWPDMMLGLGYSFRLLDGLGAEIIYQCGIREIYTKDKLQINGIKAGLYYVF